MWAVVKIDRKKLLIVKNELKKKFNSSTKFYIPQILIQYYNKNKLVDREINLLGDYIFCFNENFKFKEKLNLVKFCVGVKSVLDGYLFLQKDIQNFISTCKNFENNKGHVSLNFIKLAKNMKYKFESGPFVNKIFEIIEFQKNKINILVGKFKTNLNKKDYLIRPI